MKIEYVVSACLAGCKCRYDGKDNLCPKVKKLVDEGRAITVCPEVMGGLPTPRIPSERKDGRIINKEGFDNTIYFEKGVELSIQEVKKYNIKKAILKAKSPSCGNKFIYDGNFNKTLIEGKGLLAEKLSEIGVEIYDEGDDLDAL